jgi:hypothetical protein
MYALFIICSSLPAVATKLRLAFLCP